MILFWLCFAIAAVIVVWLLLELSYARQERDILADRLNIIFEESEEKEEEL